MGGRWQGRSYRLGAEVTGGAWMTRDELLKKLQVAVDDAMRTRLYGHLQLEFKAGYPTFLRTLNEEKLDETGNRNGQQRFTS